MTRTATPGSREDRALGAWIGLAIGDAVGTTLEFKSRDGGPPLTDMVGGGPFRMPPGGWTDDTSMALCLAESLLHDPALDPRDLMDRFVRWWRQGENSHTGSCFDIGIATRQALQRYVANGDPSAGSTDPMSAGNGGIMRLAPVALVSRDADRAADLARRQSRTTHGAVACADAADLMARILVAAIDGAGSAAFDIARDRAQVAEVAAIAAGLWRGKGRADIRSTGYVVHTLEAALWATANADGFAAAVLLAANLGDDADTVAAVTGQIAGALHGLSAIPATWLAKLAWRGRIEELGWRLLEKAA